MASVESTITEEFLTCSICFEIYKDPKTLPCLHSFCKDCIDSLTQKGHTNTYPCPICREKFLISKNGAKDLKTNFCFKNLIEFVTSTKEVKKPCSFCILKGETVDATSRCLTCNDLLCPECAEHRHRSTTLTLHHQVVSLAEVNAGKYHDEIRSKQQIPCFEHKGEDLRYFCETCDVPVCRDCIVLCHQNHNCVTPSDARKQMEENFKSLLNTLDQKLNIFKNSTKNVVSSLKKLKDMEKNVKDNLEKQANAIIRNVLGSKIKVEEEFDYFVRVNQEVLQQREKLIQVEKQKFEEALSFNNNILQRGSDIEILSMKTEIRERFSKLQSLNVIETCNVEKIITPFIRFCNEENCFKLVEAMDEENLKKSGEQANAEIPIESETYLSKESQAKELQGCSKELSSLFYSKDNHNPRNPNYTSVAWIDSDTIAVADERNQKLKRISNKGDVESCDVENCMVVSSFKDGLACKTTGKTLHVFNKSLKLKKTLSGVSILLTCRPQSSEVCWISGLKTICVLKKDSISDINIHDQHSTSNLSDPTFGHVLENGMFVISDWKKDCVFIIRRSGYIVRRKYCGTSSPPGSISSDSDLKIYVCDYEGSLIEVFTLSGVTLRTINVREIAPNPRSIAISEDGHTLIANGKSIIQIN